MNSYYCPRPEEFSLLFNYQVRLSGNWHTRVYDGEGLSNIRPLLDSGVIRVKMLTDSCIRKLGWEAPILVTEYSNGDFYLRFDGRVCIFKKISGVYNRVLFEGKVKNINQLESIMKMLDI